MKIRRIIIENFRAIEQLDVRCSDGMNVFIGDNGAGKSTVLEAFSILYSWLTALAHNPKGKGRSLSVNDVRNGTSYCYLEIEAEHDGQVASWSLCKKGLAGAGDVNGRVTNLQQLRDFAIWLNHSGVLWPMMSHYGINRNIPSVSVEKRLFDKKEKKNDKGIEVTFSWRSFFNWFYERENEENRMKARFNEKYHDESLDAIRDCLHEAFPGYRNLRVEDKPKTHFELDKNGRPLDFNALSDGEKSYITLVLDIARRLSEHSEDARNALSVEHIVLIDEVDLHLHPSWQLFVISNLRRHFSGCQFFVTSHSPLVLSSLERQGQLVILRNGVQMEVSDMPYGDNGDYILKRFFGLSEVRNPEVQQEIDNIAAELSKQHPDITMVEHSLNRLAADGVNFEESVKMRLLLAQKKKAYEKD